MKFRGWSLIGLVAIAPAAFAQILIDDFSEGDTSEFEGWLSSETVFGGGFDNGSMLGGARNMSFTATGDGAPGGATLDTTNGELFYSTLNAASSDLFLNYFDEVDFSDETSVFVDLGEGTTAGEVTLRLNSGEVDQSEVTEVFSGSGIIEFDLSELVGDAELESINFVQLQFSLPSNIGVFNTFGPGYSTFTGDPQQVVVSNISTVPEPGTMLALGLGGALVAFRKRKKQSA